MNRRWRHSVAAALHWLLIVDVHECGVPASAVSRRGRRMLALFTAQCDIGLLYTLVLLGVAQAAGCVPVMTLL